MESTIDKLAKELLEKLKKFAEICDYTIIDVFHSTGDDQRILVGVCGIPANGKSSLAHAIVQRVNELNQSPVSIACGLDGWHLPRSTLASMPNPQEAFARRGAHWTFDGDGYVEFVQRLKSTPINIPNGSNTILTAPTFSHSIKDPVADGLNIDLRHRIIALEGLYAFLSIPPWLTAAELLDERWFVDVDVADARKRIVERHVKTGVAPSKEMALERAELNDFPNGEFVMTNMLEPTRRIRSIEDRSIAI